MRKPDNLTLDEYQTFRHALKMYTVHCRFLAENPNQDMKDYFKAEVARSRKLQNYIRYYLSSAGVQLKLGPSDVQTQGNAGAFRNNKVA